MNVAAQDFPPEKFPILIEALHAETRQVVWQATVQKPQPGEIALLHIPPLRAKLGHWVYIRVTFGDGEVVEEPVQANPNKANKRTRRRKHDTKHQVN